MSFPILSVVLGVALVTVFLLNLAPKEPNKENTYCYTLSLISASLIAILSVVLFILFDGEQSHTLQFVEQYKWLPPISSIHFGLDGLSLPMFCIVGFLSPVIILASRSVSETHSPKLYYSLIFLVLISVLGSFISQDLLIFFLFWELELLPTYLLISKWGNEPESQRSKAANYFLAFTFISGALILTAIVILFATLAQTSFSMPLIHEILTTADPKFIEQYLPIYNALFILLLVAFSIKLPAIPCHTWLAKVHTSTSLPVSMIVGGFLFIMGSYGLLRFSVDIFPWSVEYFKYGLATFGAINIVLGGLFALVQSDMRKLIAYSNISHLGFITLGIAALNTVSLSGVIFQTVSHALIAVGLFYVVQLIYSKTKSFNMNESGGLAEKMPCLFFIAMFIAMVTLGLPLLIGFVAESLVFYGAFDRHVDFDGIHIATIVATLGIVLTATYMLSWLRKVFFGSSAKYSDITDILKIDKFALSLIIVVCILFGTLPSLLDNKFENKLKTSLLHSTESRNNM